MDLSKILTVTTPQFIDKPYAWVQHIPFARYLIEVLKPKIFVELGTHSGNSYFAFCQAINQLKLATKSYAVDTWNGDEHASFYPEDVFKRVRDINKEHFSITSSLLRMTFDQALEYFSENTIDLLHIDGLHTYEAVKHDFETWLPKMSNEGVIIMHDTAVREREFGVWRLWEELSTQYPSFDFLHGNGLGVLCVGKNVNKDFLSFVETAAKQPDIRNLFATLGSRVQAIQEKEDLQKELLAIKKNVRALEKTIENHANVTQDLNTRLDAHKAAIQRRNEQIEKFREEQTKHKEEVLDYKIKATENTESLRYKSDQIEELRRELARAKEEILEHKVKATETTQKINEKNAQIDKLREEQTKHKEEVLDYKIKATENTESLRYKSDQIEELRRDLARAKEEILEHKVKATESNQKINEKNAQIDKLSDELAKRKEQIHDYDLKAIENKALIVNLQEELTRRNADIEDYKGINTSINQKVSEQIGQIEKLQEELTRRNADIEDYKGINTSINQKVSEQIGQIEKLQEELTRRNADIEDYSNRLTQGSRQLEETIKKLNNTDLRITELCEEQSRLEKELKTAKQLCSAKAERIEKQANELNQKQNQITALQKAKAEAVELVRKREATIGSLQKKNENILQTNKQQKQEIDKLENQVKHILNSASWKVTKPLRWSKRVIKTILTALLLTARILYFALTCRIGKVKNEIRILKYRRIVLKSGEFDKQWYLQKYPDVAKAGVDPIIHYLKRGVIEHRDPSPKFGTALYLQQYGDVFESGINPLVHYILYGKKEGRVLKKTEPSIEVAKSASKQFVKENVGQPKSILYVIHDGGGGMVHTSWDLLSCVSIKTSAYILIAGKQEWKLFQYNNHKGVQVASYSFSNRWKNVNNIDKERTEAVQDIAQRFNITLVHIRVLLGTGVGLVDYFKERGIPVVFSFHDFSAVCPNIHLICDGKFCAGDCKAVKTDTECSYSKNWFGSVKQLRHEYRNTWAEMVAKSVVKCDKYVVTSWFTKDIIMKNYPMFDSSKFKLIEHGRNFSKICKLAKAPSTRQPIDIVILGALNQSKGIQLVLDMMRHSNKVGGNIVLHVLGEVVGLHEQYASTPNIVMYGKYNREELHKYFEKIKPSFTLLPSIWHETFAHTLTESWAMGVPPIVSSYGALGERVERERAGWALEPIDATEWYDKIIYLSKNLDEYNSKLENIHKLKFKNIAQMANEYIDIYNEVLKNKSIEHIDTEQQPPYKPTPAIETEKIKEQELRKIKKLRIKLLENGFVKRAYNDINSYAQQSDNKYLKSLAAWELSLWHSNFQNRQEADKTLKYLGLIEKQLLPVEMQQQIAVIESESLMLTGNKKEAKQTAERALNKEWNLNLLLAIANTQEEPKDKLLSINKIYKNYNLFEIDFANSQKPLYNQLTTKVLPGTELSAKHDKVTVIVPTYNAEKTIKTTLCSLQKQTYSNIEIIVVDDCSTDDTARIVHECAQNDNRIVYMKTAANSGPYVARNLALSVAKGKYVTCNDSDDWSHAQKIEYQVAHLEQHPTVIANISQWARVSEDFTFSRRNNPGYYLQINLSSMMFRRDEVMEKLGFWDSVRYGADTEFHKRMIIAFGQDKIVNLPPVPLSFARLTDTSLTANPISGYPGYPMGARKEYRDSYLYFYQGKPNLKYDRIQKVRPFAIPDMMNPNIDNKLLEKRNFRLIVVADLRIYDPNVITIIKNCKNKYNQINCVGLVDTRIYDIDSGQQANHEIRKLIDGEKIKMLVYGDNVTCEKMIIAQHNAVADEQKFIAKISAANIFVLVDNVKRGENDQKTAEYINRCAVNTANYFGQFGRWFFVDPKLLSDTSQFLMEEIIQYVDCNPTHIPFYKKNRNIKKNNEPVVGNMTSENKEPNNQHNSHIITLTTDNLDGFRYSYRNGVIVIMPCIDVPKGMQTAEILYNRAGMECLIVIAHDTKRQGFIKTLNQVSQKADVAYVVYLAQDAFPGRNWLKTAYEKLEQQQKGLLAFNDGKWNGRIASFGMVRKAWVETLYGNMILYEGYKSHKADNELTVIARVTQQYIYDHDSSLIEVDYNKDIGGSNIEDDNTFYARFMSGFGGKVSIDLLEPIAAEYSTKNMNLVIVKNNSQIDDNNTFVLYRIIGNDLIPRHKKGQSYENIKFILDNEPDFVNCKKVYILNRIIDIEEEQRIVELLKSKKQEYQTIPFIKDDYKNVEIDYQTFGFETLFASRKFKKFDSTKQRRAVAAAYRLKNNYIMNNNGARNYALRDGRNKARWILPFDGNCYFTKEAWQSMVKDIVSNNDKQYQIVPMCRVTDNNELLTPDFVAQATEEPQIVFRNDAELSFDERFCYGRRPKVEMLWRLGVPGRWDNFPRNDAWDFKRPVAFKSKLWSNAGWVARLYSGNKELEYDTSTSMKDRAVARVEAIISTIEQVDKTVFGDNAEILSKNLAKLTVKDISRRMLYGTVYHSKDFLKDILKDLAHRLPLIPYRKPSKRYKIWNRTREKLFLSRMLKRYKHNQPLINCIKATVIMPTYNRGCCIEQAIESVVKQTHRKWELVVVDDGSTDNIADIEQKLKNNNAIRFIHTEHRGVSHARNIGIEHAKGKYIFYLDTDNQWSENYLRTMITYLETENIKACYSAIQLIGDKGETLGYYGERFNYNECRELNYIDINGFGHVNVKGSRHLRFDESLKRLVDWDFILTLAQELTVRYAPFIGVRYYDGQKNNRITFTESTDSEINEIINKIQAKHPIKQ